MRTTALPRVSGSRSRTLGETPSFIDKRLQGLFDPVKKSGGINGTLSTRHDSNRAIALKPETKLTLEKTFGVKLDDGSYDMTSFNEFLKESEIYGGRYEALTESEANALLSSKGLDEARNRRAKTGQNRNGPNRGKTLSRTRSDISSEKDRSSLTQNGTNEGTAPGDEGGSFLAVSEAEIYKNNGDYSQSVRGMYPVLGNSSPFIDRRLQQFFDSVNQVEIYKNGETDSRSWNDRAETGQSPFTDTRLGESFESVNYGRANEK
jgi:hypothetical protein